MMKKPVYIRFSLLDLPKSPLYQFHYSYMQKIFGDKCKILYCDTGSSIYEITGINVYEIMKEDIEWFGTSDYPENNQFGLSRVNKKVIGLMKDECCGNIMLEFIGQRSKYEFINMKRR